MNIRVHTWQLCFCLCSLVFYNNAHALGKSGDTINRAYPVPGHGELLLDVPARWEVTYVSQGDNKPPLITFYNKDATGRTDKEVFQLNISILWDDGYKRDITDPSLVRKMVEDSGKDLLQRSRESELGLQPIEGAGGTGYYFTLSDAAPRPGEYPYLMQGALVVDDVVIIFSLFTYTQDSRETAETLTMLRQATRRYQPDV